MSTVTLRDDLRACRAIVCHAVQHRRSQGSLWLTWALLALTVLFAGLRLTISFDSRESRDLCMILSGIAFGMFSIMWWTLLTASVAQQYNAVCARLLPRARERMGMVVAAVGLSVALAATALLGPLLGQPLLIFGVTMLALAEVVLAGQWRILLGLFLFGQFLWPANAPVGMEQLLGSPPGAALGMAVLGVEIRAAWLHLFGPAGRLPPERPVGLDQRGPRPASQARPGSTRAELLVYGLGPTPPWQQCLRSLAFWATAAFMLGLMMLWDGGLRVQFARALVLSVVLVGQFTSAHTIVGMLYDSRLEQGLIRLSAAAPQAAMLNRALARILLAQTVRVWAGSLAAAVAAFWLTGAPWNQTAQAAALCALIPFACSGLFADYSRTRTVPRLHRLGWIAATIAGAALVLAVSFGPAEPLVFAGVAILVMLAGSGLALARWRGMLRAPVAFPAGRIG